MMLALSVKKIIELNGHLQKPHRENIVIWELRDWGFDV